MDANAIRALIISTLAGLSTMLGAVLIFVVKDNNKKFVSISLGFAAGVMISVSLTDLFPTAQTMFESYSGFKLSVVYNVLFLAAGIVIAALLDKLIPHEEKDEQTGEVPHKNLFRVGFVSMLAIALHNFPEGIATFMAGYSDFKIGVSIAIAIAFHNIPEGISVAIPIYYATGSKTKALKYTFLSGVAEPLGAFAAFLILMPVINDFMLGALLSLVSGIMIYIAIEEMIPTSRQYGFEREALISTFVGICLMPITNII